MITVIAMFGDLHAFSQFNPELEKVISTLEYQLKTQKHFTDRLPNLRQAKITQNVSFDGCIMKVSVTGDWYTEAIRGVSNSVDERGKDHIVNTFDARHNFKRVVFGSGSYEFMWHGGINLHAPLVFNVKKESYNENGSGSFKGDSITIFAKDDYAAIEAIREYIKICGGTIGN